MLFHRFSFDIPRRLSVGCCAISEKDSLGGDGFSVPPVILIAAFPIQFFRGGRTEIAVPRGTMARFAVAVCLCFFLLSSTLFAQTDPSTGVQMWSANEFGIDLATSAVNIQIPVRSKAGPIPFSSFFVGTSHAYIGTTGNGKTIGINGITTSSSFLNYVDSTLVKLPNTVSTNNTCNGDFIYSNFAIQDLSG